MLFKVGDKYLNSAHIKQVSFKVAVVSADIEDMRHDDYFGQSRLVSVLFKGSIHICPIVVMTDDEIIEFVDFQQVLNVSEILKCKRDALPVRSQGDYDRVREASKLMVVGKLHLKLEHIKGSILAKLAQTIGIGISPTYGKTA